MSIEVLVQDSATKKGYDLSQVIKDLTISTQMEEQPGKLILNYIDNIEESFSSGSSISVKVDGKGVFLGYVFKIKPYPNHEVQLTAYDQMRYLQNKDTYNLSSMSCDKIFEKICQDCQLKYKVIDRSRYNVAAKIFDNESYYSMIQYGLDQALINEGYRYIVRDNYGTLEHVELRTIASNLLIGEDSLLTDYDYELSIDDETYNQIKLIKEDSETKKRKVYIVKDSSNISRWGVLQYFEKVDENMNSAQIESQATNLLRTKNKETKTLKLTCIGDLRIREGVAVVVGIKALEKYGVKYNSYYFVNSCDHKFENGQHTMTLDMEVLT